MTRTAFNSSLNDYPKLSISQYHPQQGNDGVMLNYSYRGKDTFCETNPMEQKLQVAFWVKFKINAVYKKGKNPLLRNNPMQRNYKRFFGTKSEMRINPMGQILQQVFGQSQKPFLLSKMAFFRGHFLFCWYICWYKNIFKNINPYISRHTRDSLGVVSPTKIL